ncbi:hypothetical protein TL16_g13112, partial [Triparma laevis f. inornata]
PYPTSDFPSPLEMTKTSHKIVTEIVVPDFIYTDAGPNMAVDLHGVASFYGDDKLKDICAAIVKKEIDAENATALLQRTHNAICTELKEIVMEHAVKSSQLLLSLFI